MKPPDGVVLLCNSHFLKFDRDCILGGGKLWQPQKTKMSESRIVPKKNAVKGQARAKAKRVYGTIEGFKIPRKITAEAAAPRKETALDVSANTAVIINQQFGAHGAHQNRGKLRPKSPFGANMSLSRRLSRRIIQGSPLRSPM